jgi:hypothetical protein
VGIVFLWRVYVAADYNFSRQLKLYRMMDVVYCHTFGC